MCIYVIYTCTNTVLTWDESRQRYPKRVNSKHQYNGCALRHQATFAYMVKSKKKDPTTFHRYVEEHAREVSPNTDKWEQVGPWCSRYREARMAKDKSDRSPSTGASTLDRESEEGYQSLAIGDAVRRKHNAGIRDKANKKKRAKAEAKKLENPDEEQKKKEDEDEESDSMEKGYGKGKRKGKHKGVGGFGLPDTNDQLEGGAALVLTPATPEADSWRNDELEAERKIDDDQDWGSHWTEARSTSGYTQGTMGAKINGLKNKDWGPKEKWRYDEKTDCISTDNPADGTWWFKEHNAAGEGTWQRVTNPKGDDDYDKAYNYDKNDWRKDDSYTNPVDDNMMPDDDMIPDPPGLDDIAEWHRKRKDPSPVRLRGPDNTTTSAKSRPTKPKIDSCARSPRRSRSPSQRCQNSRSRWPSRVAQDPSQSRKIHSRSSPYVHRTSQASSSRIHRSRSVRSPRGSFIRRVQGDPSPTIDRTRATCRSLSPLLYSRNRSPTPSRRRYRPGVTYRREEIGTSTRPPTSARSTSQTRGRSRSRSHRSDMLTAALSLLRLSDDQRSQLTQANNEAQLKAPRR